MRHRQTREERPRSRVAAGSVAAAFVLACWLVAGCGRLGYDAVVTAGGSDADTPELDAPLPELPGDAADDRLAEPPRDAAPADLDTATPDAAVEARPPVDVAPVPPDLAPDRAPDRAPVADAPVDNQPACEQAVPRADIIFDLEDGAPYTNRVGERGDTVIHLIDPTPATLSVVTLARCQNQRALRVDGAGPGTKAVLVQARLMLSQNGETQWYDARAYRGIRVSARASEPLALRVKVPNWETVANGNDHFFGTVIPPSTGWETFILSFTSMRQAGIGEAFPRLDTSVLFAIEFSANIPAGASLWLDDVAFVR